MAMGVCGIVLVSLGMTLPALAENCGTTSVQLGSVFVARGMGALLGPLASAPLYSNFPHPNTILGGTLMLLATVLLSMPMITKVATLHFSFGMLGFCTALADTGCQIMTRTLHGREAGPWLGGNTAVFGLAGACVPLLAYFDLDVSGIYTLITILSGLVALVVLLSPTVESGTFPVPPAAVADVGTPERYPSVERTPDHGGRRLMGPRQVTSLPYHAPPRSIISPPRSHTSVRIRSWSMSSSGVGSLSVVEASPHIPSSKPSMGGKRGVLKYQIEIIYAITAFCIIGGLVSATAYLGPFVVATSGSATASGSGDLLVLVLWVSVTIGRLFGLQVQRVVSTRQLFQCFYGCLAVGAAGAGIMMVHWATNVKQAEEGQAPSDLAVLGLVIAVGLYGVTSGPAVGFLYDLVNRLTIPSEVGMAIVMFGLNLGASLAPFTTAGLWCLVDSTRGTVGDTGGPVGASVLPGLLMFVMMFPIPLIFLTGRLGKKPTQQLLLHYPSAKPPGMNELYGTNSASGSAPRT
eukprot:CAMPEP_0113937060 /NCGR_PEP_ID=MMETSP1339-20121228/3762_1 /TAXON_ID=94617 /ORGANISM="Fibrocapsa japonica" /LENGTH=519 /DNA_ID=CAMNT_0000939687 /DNA_START=422 /DNA_END=1981 /DNA_ORIENTATION=+ /assembly_acc=CAM_ASM_000762